VTVVPVALVRPGLLALLRTIRVSLLRSTRTPVLVIRAGLSTASTRAVIVRSNVRWVPLSSM
jgi:hypothetical protein